MDYPDLYATGNNDLQRQSVRDFVDEFGDKLGQFSGRCLDIGSGPGDVAVEILLPKLNPNAKLICSDVSESMVKYGQKKYKKNSRLSFVKLDIEAPVLPKEMVGQFDNITSFYCLHWCRDYRRVFRNIFDLLRPGGKIFVVFVARASTTTTYKSLALMPRYKPYVKDPDRYIPIFEYEKKARDILKPLLESLDFDIHHCSLREKSWTFDTLDDLRGFMTALDPYLKLMPDDIKEEYKKDLTREAAKRIVVYKKNNDNEKEYSALLIYDVLVVHTEKPATDN